MKKAYIFFILLFFINLDLLGQNKFIGKNGYEIYYSKSLKDSLIINIFELGLNKPIYNAYLFIDNKKTNFNSNLLGKIILTEFPKKCEIEIRAFPYFPAKIKSIINMYGKVEINVFLVLNKNSTFD